MRPVTGFAAALQLCLANICLHVDFLTKSWFFFCGGSQFSRFFFSSLCSIRSLTRGQRIHQAPHPSSQLSSGRKGTAGHVAHQHRPGEQTGGVHPQKPLRQLHHRLRVQDPHHHGRATGESGSRACCCGQELVTGISKATRVAILRPLKLSAALEWLYRKHLVVLGGFLAVVDKKREEISFPFVLLIILWGDPCSYSDPWGGQQR